MRNTQIVKIPESTKEVYVNTTCDMCEKFPEFSLTGTLEAQGEEPDDTWQLVMENNKAFEK